MNTVLRAILAIGLTWSSASIEASSFSDDHCELARQFLKETEAEKSYIEGIKEALDLQIESVPQMQSFKGVFSKWQDTYLTWDVFEEKYVEIICEAYSEEEIRSLIEFYKTPIGQKQLEKSDQIVLEVMRFSELVAARHQPELNIMITKRAKELELEVENLFPEFKAEEENSEIVIHTATEFQSGSMQQLVYTLPKTEAIEGADIDLKTDGSTLSAVEAMGIAFSEHYSQIGIDEDEFWEETSITLSNFKIDSDDLEFPEAKTLWFYSVNCSVFGNYPAFGTPADIVVLMDGHILKPKKQS
ncbi:DUF2059 domain-containing protein [Pelagicoccus mobilis]|uniref:DUF2059 domain-containing protein n=1 Tax=Pelagicoccus mobilis TaxID=415221 RepID=A0A934S203_9BACT|nr:DUF2059 domain-containing protein [Pelagicoccus mobilis]MBK1879599.1 DUF2059 domain-containing protein [Pelagicoccus mobilis]